MSDCEHKSFKAGICEACGFECEHDFEDHCCLFCGEVPDGPEPDVDLIYEQMRDSKSEGGIA